MRLQTPLNALFAVTCALAFPVLAVAEIHWRTDLQVARQESVATGKPMLAHFWADWCGPCLALEKNVFSKPELAHLETAFIPVKLNFDKNRRLAEALGVSRLPTDIVISPTGETVGRFGSPQEPAAYMAKLAQFAGQASSPTRYAARNTVSQSPPYSGAKASPSQPPVSGFGSAPRATQQPASGVGRRASNFVPVARQSNANPQQSTASTSPTEGSRYQIPTNNGSNSQADVPGAVASFAPGDSMPAPHNASQPNIPAATPEMRPESAAMQVVPENAGQSSSPIFSQPTASAGQPQTPPLGMEGHCPVTLKQQGQWKPGDKRYGIIHRGRLYLFAGKAEKDLFWNNPDLYSPVMSGSDPVLAIDSGKQVAGLLKHGVWYNGMVYLFSSEATLAHFAKNPEHYANGIRQAMMQESAAGSVRR